MSLLTTVTDSVTGVIDRFGGWSVFALMTLESACIPVPSEVIQLYAGFMVAQGRLGLVTAIVAGTLGNLLGSLVAWAVGYRLGRPFVVRWGRYVHLTEHRLAQSERWFDRYGARVVFWARMLPIVRTFISLPAGFARMRVGRFALYTTLGALPWVTALTLAGRSVGRNWHSLEGQLKYLDYAVAVVLVAVLVWLVVRRRRRPAGPERPAADLD